MSWRQSPKMGLLSTTPNLLKPAICFPNLQKSGVQSPSIPMCFSLLHLELLQKDAGMRMSSMFQISFLIHRPIYYQSWTVQ